MYDWSTYFEDKTIKTSLRGITQMHHCKETPGIVKVRNHSDDLQREIKLLKDSTWRPT